MPKKYKMREKSEVKNQKIDEKGGPWAIIDSFRKSLVKKLEENKLGDTTFSFSEEEKKGMVEDAKLAQASLSLEEINPLFNKK